MKELDRSRPMRAVHRETGEVADVSTVDQSKALRIGGMTAYFDRYGNPKDDFCPWRVENVPTYTEAVMELGRVNFDAEAVTPEQLVAAIADTIPVDAALWERVTALVRNVASFPRMRLTTSAGDEIDGTVTSLDLAVGEARTIAELLPPVIDPDLIEARKIAADALDEPETAKQVMDGKSDHSVWVKSALTAIKRGRALERGE